MRPSGLAGPDQTRARVPHDTPAPEFFRALEHQRTQALVCRDMKTCWQLHAPDYMLISPPGRSFTRERYLGLIGDGSLQYLRWEPEDMQVRATPHMGIVRYRATLELASGDGAPSKPFLCWHTDSYELTADGWQAVWSQATRIVP